MDSQQATPKDPMPTRTEPQQDESTHPKHQELSLTEEELKVILASEEGAHWLF